MIVKSVEAIPVSYREPTDHNRFPVGLSRENDRC